MSDEVSVTFQIVQQLATSSSSYVIPYTLYKLGIKEIAQAILLPSAEKIGIKFREKLDSFLNPCLLKIRNKPVKLNPSAWKVLQKIVSDAPFVTDVLKAEYEGGLLASALTSKDNFTSCALPFINMVQSMSLAQIKMHFVIYHLFRKLALGKEIKVAVRPELEKLKLFIPADTVTFSLGFENMNMLSTTLLLLDKDRLIGREWNHGPKENLTQLSKDNPVYKNVPGAGVVVTPSALGIQLFYWAYGYGEKYIDTFLTEDLQFEEIQEIVLPENCILL